ncbi:MAG: hypothetical protein ACLQVI_37665 [Polyangiaceae bacterium]
MSELSPTTKALFRAAREDGPGAAARSRIWTGVAVKAAGGSALGAAGTKAAASAGTAKLFVMGALLGSAVTVGIAATILHVGRPSLRPDPTLVSLTAEADPQSAPPLAPAAPAPATVQDEPAAATAHAKRSPMHARPIDDSLEREAELVAEARGAVVRGQPEAALSAIHAAQALPGHALEPEELSLEVRALRAMGELDAANAADAKLRARFPDHALAR